MWREKRVGFFSVIIGKKEDSNTQRHKHAKLQEGESIHAEDHLLIHLCLPGNLGLGSRTVSKLKLHYLLLFKVNNVAFSGQGHYLPEPACGKAEGRNIVSI